MDTAVMALIGGSAIGYLVADGEKARVRYIRAMRRSLLRMHELIRYEQPPLCELLVRVNLRATPEEKRLTALLHECAARLKANSNPQLLQIFSGLSASAPGYAVLSEEDRGAFENLLGELGRTGMEEQLRLIDRADERLRRREEAVAAESALRARLIRTLGVTGGAAAFLLLI